MIVERVTEDRRIIGRDLRHCAMRIFAAGALLADVHVAALVMALHDVFGFRQTGVDADRVAQGHFYTSGIRPKCLERLESAGTKLPISMFERSMTAPLS